MVITRTLWLLLACLIPPGLLADETGEALWAATRKGDAQAVKALLAKGADVNTQFRYGATALSYAADRGHLEVVKVLIEHGADVNVKDTFYGNTPLGWAAFRGHAEVAKALLDKGAEGTDPALHAGVARGHIGVVKIILNKGGVKPDALTSALKVATKAGHAEITELLRKAGAVEDP